MPFGCSPKFQKGFTVTHEPALQKNLHVVVGCPSFNEQPVTQEYRYSRCPHSIRELLSVARSMFTLAESRSSTMITQSESETEPGSILFPLPLHDPENYKDASLALPNNPIVSFKAVDQQVSRQTEGVFRIDTKLSAAHKTFHKHPYLTRSINI